MTDSQAPLLLPEGPFSGHLAFAQNVRLALECAAREGWSQMIWSDANFLDWPLRERAVIASLNAWSKRGRRLILLAHHFNEVQRHQPRFVQWRSTWDHLVECRINKQVDVSEFPSALWSPHWVMRRMNVEHSTGVSGYEPQRRVLLKEELEECLRQSSPGFPSTVLGL